MCRVCLFYAEAVKKMQREAVISQQGRLQVWCVGHLKPCDIREE